MSFITYYKFYLKDLKCYYKLKLKLKFFNSFIRYLKLYEY